jgi:phosphoribosylformylglycinamidine synthase
LREVGSYIFVIGKTLGHLYQSEFFREVVGFKDGPPPEINLFNEKNNGLLINKLILEKLVNSVHDISAGGILVTLCEMCIAGKIGAKIKVPHDKINIHKYLFGEDQSRYIIEVSKKNKNEVSKILEENNIYYDIIGKTQNDRISLENEFDVKLSELDKLNTIQK